LPDVTRNSYTKGQTTENEKHKGKTERRIPLKAGQRKVEETKLNKEKQQKRKNKGQGKDEKNKTTTSRKQKQQTEKDNTTNTQEHAQSLTHNKIVSEKTPKVKKQKNFFDEKREGNQ
jgi:hypothetical protein